MVVETVNGVTTLTGQAYWTGDNPGNTNEGNVNGTISVANSQAEYNEDGCTFNLFFSKDTLTVKNDNGQCGGANVTFDGTYTKQL